MRKSANGPSADGSQGKWRPREQGPAAPPKVDPRFRVDIVEARTGRGQPGTSSASTASESSAARDAGTANADGAVQTGGRSTSRGPRQSPRPRPIPESDPDLWAVFVQSVDPFEFERIVLGAYQRAGYHVMHTPLTGDEGLDGVIFRGSEAIGIQIKRYRHRVGGPMMREFVGSLAIKDLRQGVFITTGGISKDARAAAQRQSVSILTGTDLREFILAHARPAVIQTVSTFDPAGKATRARRKRNP
jgi:hypothetical protein